MIRKISLVLAAVTLLFFVTTQLALAWPDRPPVRATISGPGIKGEVEITEPETLRALRLGGLEDFNAGIVDAPENRGEGYKITRYFDDDFNFGLLTYYPNTPRSFVYFEDGPQLEGDHTRYNKKWLYATSDADATIRGWLAKHGATTFNAVPLDADAINSISPWLIAIEASTALVIGLTSSLLFWRWKRAR